MSKDRDKLFGQRRAIWEHIEKWKTYPDPRDKDFALKTIRNCQAQVADIRRKSPQLRPDWIDTWKPGLPIGAPPRKE